MKHIAQIPITQNGVRDLHKLKNMIAFVRSGGIFNDEYLSENHNSDWAKNRISIARLEDGAEYFHDGHHRLLSVWLAGREYLYDDEVEYFDITYAHYHEVNFKTNWLTPFCLKTEIRLPNVHQFKSKVLEMPQNIAEKWVRENRNMFCTLRNGIYYVSDLVKSLNLE